jgi:hypothetical protein
VGGWLAMFLWHGEKPLSHLHIPLIEVWATPFHISAESLLA